jgi:hypothetical protein
MTDRVMGTAAQEAIRIAEAYLPNASIKRKMALANEIADAISLCEQELIEEFERGVKLIVAP